MYHKAGEPGVSALLMPVAMLADAAVVAAASAAHVPMGVDASEAADSVVSTSSTGDASASSVAAVASPSAFAAPLPSATRVSGQKQAAPWRCCPKCGLTFRTLGSKNAHAAACQGPANEAAMRDCINASADIMVRWQDAPADELEEAKDRVDVPADVLFQEWPTILAWLESPAGYASVGGGRQMKSPRTAAILREDAAFCLSFMASPKLGHFCDPDIVRQVVTRIVRTYRSPTRMYNLIGCMQKVTQLLRRVPLRLTHLPTTCCRWRSTARQFWLWKQPLCRC